MIFLLFGFTSLVNLFPIICTDTTKHERDLTINVSSTTSSAETEKICNDGRGNDNDGKIGLDDHDCSAEPTSPTEGTCGLKILDGVPIDYGPLNPGQKSLEQKVRLVTKELQRQKS